MKTEIKMEYGLQVRVSFIIINLYLVDDQNEKKAPNGSNMVEETSLSKKRTSKLVATIQKPSIPQVNGVFAEEEEEAEDTIHQIKKKIKPFEITREVNNL